MDPLAADLVVDALRTALELLLPFAAVIVGVAVVVSLLQALFQVNDAGVVFFPKMAASLVLALLLGPWLAMRLSEFGARSLSAIAGLG